jgi:hypothetical protein
MGWASFENKCADGNAGNTMKMANIYDIGPYALGRDIQAA